MNMNFAEPLMLRDAQRVDDVVGRVGDIDSSVDSMSQSNGKLAVSFYALIAWVVVVTVGLAVVAIVALRRRRALAASRDDDDTAMFDDDSASMSSSKYGMGPGSAHAYDEPAPTGVDLTSPSSDDCVVSASNET